MACDVSKKEFLKRYLENDEDKEKKRKKKHKPSVSRIKILDENIDLKSILFGEKAEEEVDDDAPLVAEIIDERPLEAKVKEQYETTKWKKLTYDSGENLVSQQSLSDSHNSLLKPIKINSSSDIPSSRNLSEKKQNVSSVHNRALSSSKEHQHRKARHDSSSDNSVQKGTHLKDRKGHNSDSDYSPPRNPEHSTRHDSDSDCSLPRNYKHSSQKRERHDSDSDLSPPRGRNSNMIDYSAEKCSDRSADRKRFSPLRNNVSHVKSNVHRKKMRDSDSDLSPERIRGKMSHMQEQNVRSFVHRRNSDSDFSPPTLSRNREKSPLDESSRPVKTLSGLKAGLQNAATLKQETQELRERERKQINKLHDDLSGRNADTIIRDRKTGKKRNIEAENRVKEEEERKKSEQQEKYSKWGKGIEQEETRKNKVSDDLYEMSKPLARYQDDEDLDEMLKSVIYDDDPMSAYMKKKKRKNAPNVPMYNGPPPPPNRFGIQPGHRWDGVDRSNGFERKYFEKHNTTKAIQEEAYLWSVQNM